MSEIVRFAQGLTQAQKLLLGFPRCKKNRTRSSTPDKKRARRPRPRAFCEDAFKGVPIPPASVSKSGGRVSESRNHWIRDAQYKENLILPRKPIAILNRSLLINACAFITNTLRIREGKSTPILRESFQKHPSKALSLIMRPFGAQLPA